jgi:hypothetical protein
MWGSSNNCDALKQTEGGGTGITFVPGNSYKAIGESLTGLRPNYKLVLMDFSDKPLVITDEIIANRWRNIL